MRLGAIERHFWLTRSVARTLGVSLSEAMATGRLSARDYAAMVTSCRACTRREICEQWLASRQDRPSRAPAHCAHAETLDRLR